MLSFACHQNLGARSYSRLNTKALQQEGRCSYAGRCSPRVQKQSSCANVLAKELEVWWGRNLEVTFWQYVDDTLLGTETEMQCMNATVSLLNFLGLVGYRAS